MALPWASQNKALPYSSSNSQSIVNLLTNKITINRAASFGPSNNKNNIFAVWTPAIFHKNIDIGGMITAQAVILLDTLTALKIKTKALEGQWPISGAGPQGLPKTISNGSPALGTGFETPAQWHTFVLTEGSLAPPAPPTPGSIYKITIADVTSELIYLMDDSGGAGYDNCRIEFPNAPDVTLSEFDNITFTIVNLTVKLITISAGQDVDHPLPTGVNCSTRGTNQINSIGDEILANGGSKTFRFEGTSTGYNVWAIN